MNTPLNIIFCGTPDFAVPSLQALLDDPQFNVTAVVTQPDRPAGRKQLLTAPPVKELAQVHNLPVIQPQKLQVSDIKPYTCDVLIVVAFGQLLSQSVLDYPNIAPVNVHGSLLPRWRGASPIQASIAAGDSVTGVTIQQMVQELDAGDILGQKEVPIEPHTTAVELFEALSHLGAQALIEVLSKPLTPASQNQAEVTHCSKLTREDGFVTPNTHTAEQIERLHRAYYPWPGVTLQLQDPIKLHQVSLIAQKNSVELPCKDQTTLYIQVAQKPGEPQKPANQIL